MSNRSPADQIQKMGGKKAEGAPAKTNAPAKDMAPSGSKKGKAAAAPAAPAPAAPAPASPAPPSVQPVASPPPPPPTAQAAAPPPAPTAQASPMREQAVPTMSVAGKIAAPAMKRSVAPSPAKNFAFAGDMAQPSMSAPMARGPPPPMRPISSLISRGPPNPFPTPEKPKPIPFKPEVTAQYCPKNHFLLNFLTTKDNGWACDGRKRIGGCKKGCTDFRQTKGWIRYSCPPCDFDLCEGCFAEDYDEAALTVDEVDPDFVEAKVTEVEPSPIVNFASIPEQLEAKLGELDQDGALRPTIINIGKSWTMISQAGILSPPTTKTLSEDEQKQAKNDAFDLLDALTRSGSLNVLDASLHVVVCSTHCFDKSVVDSLIEGNINPIERVEKSSLIVASTIHSTSPAELVVPKEATRLQARLPQLFSSK